MTTPDMKQGFCQENQKEDPEKLMEFRDKREEREHTGMSHRDSNCGFSRLLCISDEDQPEFL